ncbi:MAG: alpha/beta hydrolase [Anaerovoracaceae bacterium]
MSSVAESKIPVLIIHGEADNFVPCYMAREIYDACRSEKELLTVPGAGHGLSYLIDSQLYEETVNDFLRRFL